MGTHIELTDSKFRIPADLKPGALAALRVLSKRADLMGGGTGRTGFRGEWFSFTDPDEIRAATTLADMMAAFRWPVHEDADGNIDGIEFSGQKLGDDRQVFDALAPFIEDGSFIEIDGDVFIRWEFRGGRLCGVEV